MPRGPAVVDPTVNQHRMWHAANDAVQSGKDPGTACIAVKFGSAAARMCGSVVRPEGRTQSERTGEIEMNGLRGVGVLILGSVAILVVSRGAHAQTPQPAPATKPAETAKPPAAPTEGTPLKLTGLTLTVPEGWVEEKKVEASPTGPKAFLKSAKPE